eukprot:gnl/Hemi2/28806_TR9550_c0_g1_i2.p1 gnl/Hemi2/28806_TR9550_c0_g1~~gnl/Hemi2/28806_TR9550_c0_g1_i2.p1  ORF type:complete len:218 (-),score=23.44 gnl/Hemi2/28806_TR9550_c0_g1_i2:66-719(-)
MDFDKLNSVLSVGALVLYVDQSIRAAVIEEATSSSQERQQHRAFSHCGIYVGVDPETGQHQIAECNLDQGVCLTSFERYAEGSVGCHLVVFNLRYTGLPRDMFLAAFSRYSTDKYTRNPFQLLTAAFKIFSFLAPATTNTFFCSKFVVAVMQDVGLLHPKRPINEYSPQDLYRIAIGTSLADRGPFKPDVAYELIIQGKRGGSWFGSLLSSLRTIWS